MQNYGPDEIRERIVVPLRDESARFSEVAKQFEKLLRSGALQREYIPVSDSMYRHALSSVRKLLGMFEYKLSLAQACPRRVWREDELAKKREQYAKKKSTSRPKRKRKVAP